MSKKKKKKKVEKVPYVKRYNMYLWLPVSFVFLVSFLVNGIFISLIEFKELGMYILIIALIVFFVSLILHAYHVKIEWRDEDA